MQYITAAMMIGGQGLSIYSALQEGKHAYKMGKAQKALFEAEAEAEVQAGADEARLKRKEGREILASQIAAISASGSGLVGSNLVIMAESAKNVETDALVIERNAQTRAKALRYQGALAEYEGKVARKSARIRAFSSGAKSGGQMYMMYGGGSGGSGGYTTGRGSYAGRY